MALTAEYLTERKKEAEAERDRLRSELERGRAIVEQLTGAINVLGSLLREAAKEDPVPEKSGE